MLATSGSSVSFGGLLADLLDPPPWTPADGDLAWFDDVRLTRWVPRDHAPHPAQRAFLALDCQEALYGGAAGGGKSDALLMAALQYVDVPYYAALLLRKTYADLALPGAIMDRSKQWLAPSDARWNDVEKTWRFKSGATLTFGYLQTANDKYRYQSAEFQMIGFDELTQFDESDYTFLFSRLRKPAAGPLSSVPLRMRAASNPGGRGHGWVKRRLIDRKPNPDDPEDTAEKCAARVFVPAKLADNPSVDQGAYRESLLGLDAQTRKQLLDGDWNARPPGRYVYPHGLDRAEELGRTYDQWREAGELPPPVGGGVQLGIDWGIGTTHALVVWQLPGGGVYVPPCEIQVERGEPVALTERMLEVAGGLRACVGGRWQVLELDEARYDAAGAQQMATFEAKSPATVKLYRVDFNRRKKRTIGYLRHLLDRTARGEQHRIIAISPGNVELLRQLRLLEQDELGNVVKHDDHGPDALIAGVWPVAAEFPDMTDYQPTGAEGVAA